MEGQGGLFEYIEQRLKENGHVLIVLAEGAGQEYIAQSMKAGNGTDASGNRLLSDVGLWLTQKVKVFCPSFSYTHSLYLCFDTGDHEDICYSFLSPI